MSSKPISLSNQQSFFEQLPQELVPIIFSFGNTQMFGRLAQVCKKFNQLIWHPSEAAKIIPGDNFKRALAILAFSFEAMESANKVVEEIARKFLIKNCDYHGTGIYVTNEFVSSSDPMTLVDSPEWLNHLKNAEDQVVKSEITSHQLMQMIGFQKKPDFIKARTQLKKIIESDLAYPVTLIARGFTERKQDIISSFLANAKKTDDPNENSGMFWQPIITAPEFSCLIVDQKDASRIALIKKCLSPIADKLFIHLVNSCIAPLVHSSDLQQKSSKEYFFSALVIIVKEGFSRDVQSTLLSLIHSDISESQLSDLVQANGLADDPFSRMSVFQSIMEDQVKHEKTIQEKIENAAKNFSGLNVEDQSANTISSIVNTLISVFTSWKRKGS